MINKIKTLSIKRFFRNVYSLFKYNVLSEIRSLQSEIKLLKEKSDNNYLLTAIKTIYYLNPTPEYKLEVENLTEVNKLLVFPYKQIKSLKEIHGSFDELRHLPFVWHGAKKLYFPENWSVDHAIETYRSYIEEENLLGGNFMEKAPHQYQTEQFKVEQGDVVLDIGSAEALFALDIIDLAEKVYIFEYGEEWLRPLKATFEPYKEKVEIINRLVSEVDSNTEVRLDSFFKDKGHSNYFIKMDIEGSEINVIESSRGFFQNNANVQIACCSYHRQTDAEKLKKVFQDLDYDTEFSDGYMLFIYDQNQEPPYFRKGILRASKK